ncbi:hypothetical protein GMMP15_1030011 [Candidatus Magnetomoraceae bacterium gMMP-15]
MKVTKRNVSQKLLSYLNNSITLAELVDWAELAIMEAEFEEKDFEILREIVSHIGLADIKEFGISWDDCKYFF